MENADVSEVDILKRNSNPILRQELAELTPKCSIKCAIICYSVVMCIFIILGACIIAGAGSVIDYTVDYTNW